MNRRLAIVGVTGRMWQELHALAQEFKFTLTSGVSGRSQSFIEGVHVVQNIEGLKAESVDVVIDFSLPEATLDVVKWCSKNTKPLVSGVTGLEVKHKSALEEGGQHIPLLWAPNMSLGVAVMAKMLKHLASLDGFEFQIEELHHKRKKDKPSGTAVFLQNHLTAAVGNQVPEPLAVRGGGIFGIHRVWAMGEEEVLTIEHNAMNRRVFARGALKAADWILTQPKGFYGMNHVLESALP